MSAATAEILSGVIDVDRLHIQIEGDLQVLANIHQAYGQIRVPVLEAIDAAIENADAAAVERAAHRLRGSFKMLAADDAAEIAERLESLAREGDLGQARPVYDALYHEAELVERALRALNRS